MVERKSQELERIFKMVEANSGKPFAEAIKSIHENDRDLFSVATFVYKYINTPWQQIARRKNSPTTHETIMFITIGPKPAHEAIIVTESGRREPNGLSEYAFRCEEDFGANM